MLNTTPSLPPKKQSKRERELPKETAKQDQKPMKLWFLKLATF